MTPIFIGRIVAIHSAQNLVTTRLYRQMKMSADIPARGHHLDQLFTEIFRMRGHEADSTQAGNLVHRR